MWLLHAGACCYAEYRYACIQTCIIKLIVAAHRNILISYNRFLTLHACSCMTVCIHAYIEHIDNIIYRCNCIYYII